MKKAVNSLIEALALGPREHIALVGGGGKTTLMLALAEELTRKGTRVIAATTTKVWRREALQYRNILLVDDEADWNNKKAERSNSPGTVFVGRNLLDSGKVEGISASVADEIFRGSEVDYLIVEADGSAGHPLKAPAEHEPVIPSSVTMVVAMMGLEALSGRLDEVTAFRVEQVRKVTELEAGSVFTPKAVSKLFLHPAGVFKGTPPGSRKIVFLNKGDLVEEDRKTAELAHRVLADRGAGIDRVILGSVKEGVYQIRS